DCNAGLDRLDIELAQERCQLHRNDIARLGYDSVLGYPDGSLVYLCGNVGDLKFRQNRAGCYAGVACRHYNLFGGDVASLGCQKHLVLCKYEVELEWADVGKHESALAFQLVLQLIKACNILNLLKG